MDTFESTPRPTPAERVDQRDRERDARATGMPVRQPITPTPEIAEETPPAPATQSRGRPYTMEDAKRARSPFEDVLAAASQRNRRRARSCNHGGGQS